MTKHFRCAGRENDARGILAIVAIVAGCAMMLTGRSPAGAQEAAQQPPGREPALQRPPQAGDTRAVTLPGGEKLMQVWCPPGTFKMGSPDSDADANAREKPVAEVTLTRGFWLGQTEVTQGQWKAVMGTEPWKGKVWVKEDAACPATYVSHTDAVAFCEKLNSSSGTFALPTEAQWEYACRAGQTTPFSFGDNQAKLGEYAWHDKNAYDIGEGYPHAVGTKRANAWGLRDMHGNAQEWCADWYADHPVGGIDPRGLALARFRVTRGGHFVSSSSGCRSAYRGLDDPSACSFHLGFRVAFVPTQ